MLRMSLLFNTFYVTAFIICSPYLFLKLIVNRRYRSGLLHRLGRIPVREQTDPCMWIHCASVGEVLTIKTLVKSIKKEFNRWDIVLSTNTNTGYSLAQKLFHDITVVYFPFDLSWIVDKVFNSLRPNCVILIELELWPNLLITAAKRHIPVVLLNARISEKSLKWYRALTRLSCIFRKVLTRKEMFYCARTELDAMRLINLGIPEEQISITGNMKYDNIETEISDDIRSRLLALLSINKEDRVIVCGSTHEGEEEILLNLFQRIRSTVEKVRLVIVPRHVERANEIRKLIESYGFHCFMLSSKGYNPIIEKDKYDTVILGDTIGDLRALYSIAECVFVGKSLIPQGGQNIMEPAGLAKPILVGPHTFNFASEIQLLNKNDAIKIVCDEESLYREMLYLLKNPVEARKMGNRAQSLVLEQKGATDSNIDILRKILLKARIKSA